MAKLSKTAIKAREIITAHDLRQALPGLKEVTADDYDYALGVLPPRIMRGGAFLLGEPVTVKNGAFVYSLYFESSERFFYGGDISVKQFGELFPY